MNKINSIFPKQLMIDKLFNDKKVTSVISRKYSQFKIINPQYS